jgi:hypothetical protein
MEFSWEIVSMATKDETNVDGVVLQNAVVQIQWKRIGTDGNGVTHNFLGNSFMTAENVSEENFVPFFSLTKEIVVSWLENKLGSGELDKIDEIIAKRIEKKNSIVRLPPWS